MRNEPEPESTFDKGFTLQCEKGFKYKEIAYLKIDHGALLDDVTLDDEGMTRKQEEQAFLDVLRDKSNLVETIATEFMPVIGALSNAPQYVDRFELLREAIHLVRLTLDGSSLMALRVMPKKKK